MKQNKPVVIGVTGGVGSGKSKVLSYLKSRYFCRVIEADQVGKELMKKGGSVYRALLERYGKEILAPDSEIDRKKLSTICFSSKESQAEVNAIEHGLIKEEIEKRIKRTRLPAVFLEAALLKEGSLIPLCSDVLFVHADRKTRIERLMKSRGYSAEKCEAILSLQLSDDGFREISTMTVENSGAFSDTKKALDELLKKRGIRKRQ